MQFIDSERAWITRGTSVGHIELGVVRMDKIVGTPMIEFDKIIQLSYGFY